MTLPRLQARSFDQADPNEGDEVHDPGRLAGRVFGHLRYCLALRQKGNLVRPSKQLDRQSRHCRGFRGTNSDVPTIDGEFLSRLNPQFDSIGPRGIGKIGITGTLR